MKSNFMHDVSYDQRNQVAAGAYRGVGERGKTGTKQAQPPAKTPLSTKKTFPLKFN